MTTTSTLAAKNIEHHTGYPASHLVDVIDSLSQDHSIENIEQQLIDLIEHLTPGHACHEECFGWNISPTQLRSGEQLSGSSPERSTTTVKPTTTRNNNYGKR